MAWRLMGSRCSFLGPKVAFKASMALSMEITPVRSIMAPSMTMLAVRLLPSCSAMSLQGTATTVTSSRVGASSIREELYRSSPPFSMVGSNFFRLGLFMSTAMGGSVTSGLPMGSSLITTAQLASPPRISGP